MQLITDSASCTVTLRNASLYIACSFLTIFILDVISQPSLLSQSESLLGITIEMVINLVLLFDQTATSLQDNKWLVFVWLINAVIVLIFWPIGLLAVIFNFGGYLQVALAHNFFLFLIAYVLGFVLFAYCARIVLSYFYQLWNNQKRRQQPVVV